MSKCMFKQKSIPSLKEFIFPPDNVKKLVDELSMYYQLSHQDSVELYNKWKGKTNFSGTMGQMVALDEIRDLIDLAHGKDWVVLCKAIFLLEHYNTEINLENFYKLNAQDQLQVMDTISKGQKAYSELKKWLKPIEKRNVFQAIMDANEVTIGNGKWDKFQVLKFGNVNSISNKENSIGIYPNILEIDNPNALTDYFRNLNEPLHDSLIITFMRHPKHEYKTNVYLFLIWKNQFYILNFSERRLNIDNTSGMRNPDRYIEDKFDKVWLPVDIFLDDKKKTDKTDLVVRNQKIFKRELISVIFENSPAIKAWTNMFMYRVVDYLENNHKKVQLGMTTLDVKKALEDKTESGIESRVKTEGRKGKRESFESIGDAGSYLISAYQNNIKSVVVADVNLPLYVGDKKFIQNMIKYRQRQMVADSLQVTVNKDFEKNYKKTCDQFKKFVKSQNLENIVKLALMNKEYSYIDYPQFTEKNIVKLSKQTIANLSENTGMWDYSEINTLLISTDKFNAWTKRVHSKCEICRETKWKLILTISFKDYRQICEFFKIKKEELPKQFVDHLHQQNEAYVGNSILDDTDPIDEIYDHWFRHSDVTLEFRGEEPSFEIKIPLCKMCVNKLTKEKKD